MILNQEVEYDTSSPLIRYVKRRIFQKNKNWLCIICGETGSGKSYSALRIAGTLDKGFNIERVVFTPEQFMNVVSKKRKRGDIIVWDEAGVGIPAREWYSLSNKAINYVLQTFRYENLGVIFTTPTISFIDAQARRLFHSYLETLFIDFRNECVVSKWMNIQVNPRADKAYFKYPVVQMNGKKTTIKRLYIHKPSDDLVKAYERKKRQYARDLKEDIKAEISKTARNVRDLNEIAETIRENPDPYVKEWHKKKIIDVNAIMNHFDVGDRRARKVKQMLEQELFGDSDR